MSDDAAPPAVDSAPLAVDSARPPPSAGARAPSARRREIAATLAIIGAIAAVLLGRGVVRLASPRPSVERCRAVLERYTDLSAGALPTDGAHGEGAAPQQPKRASPSNAEIARCADELTASEVDCAAHANDVDAFERCF